METLIRDLDTLGVKDEVDLTFTYKDTDKSPGKSIEVSVYPAIIDSAYKKCLSYNDMHKNKIIAANIHYDFEGMRGVGGTNLTKFPIITLYRASEVELKFSNGFMITILYQGKAEGFVVNIWDGRRGITKFVYVSDIGSSVFASSVFTEDVSIIDLFFNTLHGISYHEGLRLLQNII